MALTINITHLAAIRLFAGEHDVRYYLNGVSVQTDRGQTLLVATNGAALGVCRSMSVDGETPVPDFGVPNDDVDAIVKAAKARRLTHVEIIPSGDRFETNVGVFFKPLDGKFPDWRRVIPAAVTGEAAQFDPQYVTRCAKAAKVLGRRDSMLWIDHNGTGSALVRVPDHPEFVGVIMPFVIKKWTPDPVGAVAWTFTA